MNSVAGIFPVVLTPLRGGALDEASLRHLVDYLIDSSVHGLVILGSTSENAYLTATEKRQIIDVAVDQVRGRVPIIAGTGEVGTDATIALAQHARDAGVDAALVAMPQYYAIDFERVKAHYARVARESQLPLLYYNFPKLTHLHLTPEEIASIAKIDGVVGCKQTIFDNDEIAALVELTSASSFSVVSGTSLNLSALAPRGVRGAICGLANLAPRECVSLYDAIGKRDEANTNRLDEFIRKFVPLVIRPDGQALLKEALRQSGHPIEATVKDPLQQLTEADRLLVAEVLASTR